MSESKRLAKNTLFLFFRMFLITGVTLYTSRVVLRELGVSDYGLYSVVGGLVTMIGFFNAAMTTATQRYLSFDIGKGEESRLSKTFSATLTIHFFIAALALILAETIGIWYVNYKLVFPENRVYAVNFVYQFSVFTFLLSIIQVPYNALIIARERMNIYAYVGILEVALKLGIVFLLVYGEDKLILYAILTFVVALIIRLIYQIYCRKKFKESKYKFEYDKHYFKELLTYSGWNLFGNFAAVARGQGVNVVLNIFLGTVVNAAYGISLQVQGAVNMFVSNFQMAVNPQIIKKIALDNYKEGIDLACKASKYSFFLMLIVIVPILCNTEIVLEIWLDSVPNHTIKFVQLSLIAILIDCLSGPLMILVQAVGKIKNYQIVVGSLIILNLPISYFFLKSGFESEIVFIVSIIINLISLLFRLFFLKGIIQFNVISYIKEVLVKVWLVSLVLYLGWYFGSEFFETRNNLLSLILSTCIICFITSVFIYLCGLSSREKSYLYKKLKEKL
ncbi:oligosaccharide flippase family protein [Myroides odoratimimus]|uniref:Polysaccharide biosynthesis protein n=1 Tax=Myroides odoratimimus TaxID=76832 RepID=A0AAI8C6T7_9FLAO|nr:oligosaccharide flippase family protein [Myroides odoratimimus]ALU28039.1 hypothetical protein AS202_18630 [Myroides odoratimimus]